MIGHYFLTSLVNIRAAPFTTAAKVLTLALGLAVMVAVSGIVAHWRSTDEAITPDGRALVFTSSMAENEPGGMQIAAIPRTSPALAQFLREDVPELEAVARYRGRGDVAVDTGERNIVLKGANAEPDFLKIFRFEFVAGDPRNALRQEDAVVLTQDAAQRLFGTAPAMGRRLVLGGQRDVVVTGVIGPIPEPSQFSRGDFVGDLRFDYISAMPPYAGEVPAGGDAWSALSDVTYGLLPVDGSLTREGLKDKLAALVDRRVSAERKAEVSITLGASSVQETTELMLNAVLFGIGRGALSVTTIFFGLGVVVLGVACLNYANLATAQAGSRSRELGMRRVLGASNLGVLVQSWIDAGLTTLIALMLTIACLGLLSPLVATQTGIDVVGAIARDPKALAGVGAIVLALTFAAGLYPAFAAWRSRPMETIRKAKSRRGGRGLARILVGVQFASASALLIAVIIVGQQNAHVRRIAFDPGADPIVVLPPQTRSGVAFPLLRERLAGYPQIKAVGQTEFEPWGNDMAYVKIPRPGRPESEAVESAALAVGPGYFEARDQKMLAGRTFDEARDAGAGVLSVVVDRTFIERMGYASPQEALAKSPRNRMLIIGVVETQPYAIQSEADGGTVYSYDGDEPQNFPLVRLDKDNVDAGVEVLRKVWRELALPGTPDFRFEDQLFEDRFQTYARVGQLFMALSLVAFVIASMGLFGMAVHTTQQRLHEIGVRKTLGSTVREVVLLLMADFSKPIVIANLIAWPLAYFGAQLYLASFASRIDLTPWYFVLSLVITLSIAWLAVGGQTFKAASVRPAQVLRDA